jgi:hypothetical protein
MSRFTCKYEYTHRFGKPNHCWTVVGRHGAKHLHISPDADYGDTGGIETHYREPPDYMADDAPSHDQCWLLKAPCWHDGSSMHATEFFIPMWKSAPHDHEGMFRLLQREYDRTFSAEDAP